MTKALLIVPPFWDPICTPLGVSSLKSYAESFGHSVELFDFNCVPKVFSVQKQYFNEMKRQFPAWNNWNIERNGTEMLAFHQLLFLNLRTSSRYLDYLAEVLNVNGASLSDFHEALNQTAFDEMFHYLYSQVAEITDRLMMKVKPEVVGCSLFNSTWAGTLFILAHIKHRWPDVKTVVGGPGPVMGIASYAEEVWPFFKAHDFIDHFVVGEGEDHFLQILDDPNVPRSILSNGSFQIKTIRSKSIEELPPPNFDGLDTSRYPLLSVASSRGCPFACSFCAETVFWKGFRSLASSSLLAHMQFLSARYDKKSFYLCDSLSNHIMSPLTRDTAERNLGFIIDCYLRADKNCTDPERTKRWFRGGLTRARLGLESASQRILDEMIKKTDPERMAKSLGALAFAGIMTSTLWIVCYPGETENEFSETLKFLRCNRKNIYQADAWLFQYHPTGLAQSERISKERGSETRFSSELNRLFAVTPYRVAGDFAPEERYDRLARFVKVTKDLEIPNPYSLRDVGRAAARWQSLGH